jgi:hypothetical protein
MKTSRWQDPKTFSRGEIDNSTGNMNAEPSRRGKSEGTEAGIELLATLGAGGGLAVIV